MKTRTPLILLILFLGLAIGACRSLGSDQDTTPTTPDFSPMSYDNLVSALENAGATVEPKGEVEQPFFEVAGQIIQVNGADVQVFEFPDANASQEAAASIAPNGSSVGTTMVGWIATPHFYKTDNLIVLYLGDDPAIMKLLNASLGPQFAGG
jgi:hypothetical protein